MVTLPLHIEYWAFTEIVLVLRKGKSVFLNHHPMKQLKTKMEVYRLTVKTASVKFRQWHENYRKTNIFTMQSSSLMQQFCIILFLLIQNASQIFTSIIFFIEASKLSDAYLRAKCEPLQVVDRMNGLVGVFYILLAQAST